MKSITRILAGIVLLVAVFTPWQMQAQANYKNFKVAIYTRAYEVQKMTDREWLESTWETISNQVKVDKIYLETHRDLLIIKKDEMKKIIKFFKDQGIEVAGGITYTIDESNDFETFCYTDPKERALAQEIIELSASLFDEVILDDFFFTDCKCDLCVEAKGDRTWTEYRLELMNEAAENVILKPAKIGVDLFLGNSKNIGGILTLQPAGELPDVAHIGADGIGGCLFYLDKVSFVGLNQVQHD